MSTAAREDVQAEPELECLDDDEQLDGADAPSSCMGIYLREVHARLKAESSGGSPIMMLAVVAGIAAVAYTQFM